MCLLTVLLLKVGRSPSNTGPTSFSVNPNSKETIMGSRKSTLFLSCGTEGAGGRRGGRKRWGQRRRGRRERDNEKGKERRRERGNRWRGGHQRCVTDSVRGVWFTTRTCCWIQEVRNANPLPSLALPLFLFLPPNGVTRPPDLSRL